MRAIGTFCKVTVGSFCAQLSSNIYQLHHASSVQHLSLFDIRHELLTVNLAYYAFMYLCVSMLVGFVVS